MIISSGQKQRLGMHSGILNIFPEEGFSMKISEMDTTMGSSLLLMPVSFVNLNSSMNAGVSINNCLANLLDLCFSYCFSQIDPEERLKTHSLMLSSGNRPF